MSSSNETSFTIDVVGESGKNWMGEFKVKVRLSHRDSLRMDTFRRELLGPSPDGQPPSTSALAMANIFSKIWTHLLKAPEWWTGQGNGLDLSDEEPVVAVLNKIQELELEAKKAIQKQGQEAEKVLAEELKKTP